MKYISIFGHQRKYVPLCVIMFLCNFRMKKSKAKVRWFADQNKISDNSCRQNIYLLIKKILTACLLSSS